jgi:2'-5' RNA ligase
MGRFFTSFDEAWQFFLQREEDLEDFFADFPEGDSFILGWLLRLGDSLAHRVQDAQRALAHLEWITPLPGDFLHIGIAGVACAARRPTRDEVEVAHERARRAWAGTKSFQLSCRRLNCFHSAVVVEVRSDGPRALVAALVESGYWRELSLEGALEGVQTETFLPHLTIGVVNTPSEPTPLREALVPLRDIDFGEAWIEEATLCVVPASRSTLLDPWEVVASVSFT